MNPQPVSDIELVFPAGIDRLIPRQEEGFQAFRQRYATNENSFGWKLFSDCFYKGLTDLKLQPKEGIDPNAAWRHIRTIMGSFEPKHEDKTAACAYLIEQWFENAEWTPKKTT